MSRLTCDVNAVGTQDIKRVHSQELARQVQKAHVKIDLELVYFRTGVVAGFHSFYRRRVSRNTKRRPQRPCGRESERQGAGEGRGG